MKLTEFNAGNWINQFQYKSFLPELINHSWEIDDNQINHLLSLANIRLGELNAFSTLIPDIDFFIKMHVQKEATTSSRIEGTQTNMEDALQKIENINPERRDDWQEVRNYVEAMNEAMDNMKKLPLSNRLIKQTHQTLLQGVRGAHKQPGEFRNSQNWIGGASLNDAVFIPPHPSDINQLASDFELFLHNEELYIPDLIKIAIAHYQFETIHPFCDGNGRIGRLLITLYLVDKGVLSKPTLYLSDYFEKNKTVYYDNLTNVRTKSDMKQWLKFFLEGVRQTSESSIETFKEIIKLKAKLDKAIIEQMGKKTKLAQEFLQYLYTQPIVDSSDVSKQLNISPSTALRIIEDFIQLNVLVEKTGYKRNRIFMFNTYINIFNK